MAHLTAVTRLGSVRNNAEAVQAIAACREKEITVILTGSEIARQVELGRIRISDFDATRVSTNSYDLTLGPSVIEYREDILDPKQDNRHSVKSIPPGGLFMPKNKFMLGESVERVGSDHFVPMIHAKSGTARLGLFVHVTADLIDIGSYGKITFQLYPTLPIVLRAGWLIAQVSFWVPEGEITLYDGKYNGSEGPVASRAHQAAR
jgi:dCTP deaminase